MEETIEGAGDVKEAAEGCEAGHVKEAAEGCEAGPKSSTPKTKQIPKKKMLEISPMKILDLSWSSNEGDSLSNTLEWEEVQSVVISTELISMQEPSRQTLFDRINYLLAVRSGLQLTTSQLYAELLNIDHELNTLKKLVNLE